MRMGMGMRTEFRHTSVGCASPSTTTRSAWRFIAAQMRLKMSPMDSVGTRYRERPRLGSSPARGANDDGASRGVWHHFNGAGRQGKSALGSCPNLEWQEIKEGQGRTEGKVQVRREGGGSE